MSESIDQRYLAVPASGRGKGILVLHAWWGLNDFIRSVCDDLANAGFTALAPDLFSGKIARTVDEADQLVSDLDPNEVPAKILAAVEALGQHSLASEGMGVIGFSFGAYWSLWLAQKQPRVRAVTLFYGTDGGGGDFENSRAAFLGHFAQQDPFEPEEGVAALKAALTRAQRPTMFYTYPGTGHWFFEKDRPEAYQAQAAQLAWERTLAFLRES